MYSWNKTLVASASVLLLVLPGMPVQARAQHFDCRACNNFTDRCEEEGDIKDVCLQGEHQGELWCVAWGTPGPWCDPERSRQVRLDGTIDEGAGKLVFGESEVAPSSQEARSYSRENGRRYYRDCRGYVVARVYSEKTASQMRESTRTLTI